MSELNVYHHELRHNEYDEFYLKYEADKVITELKDKLRHYPMMVALLESDKKDIAELKDKALQYKVLNEEHCRDLNTQERFFAEQIAHQKYKRCLVMAKWSKAGMYLSYECDFKREWWNKWQKRWLEISEKFKEVK